MTKTVTFAVVHFAVAFSVAYVLTGSIAISGAVALVEPLCNTIAYHFHEKVWDRVRRRQEARSHGFGHRMLSGA